MERKGFDGITCGGRESSQPLGLLEEPRGGHTAAASVDGERRDEGPPGEGVFLHQAFERRLEGAGIRGFGQRQHMQEPPVCGRQAAARLGRQFELQAHTQQAFAFLRRLRGFDRRIPGNPPGKACNHKG